MKAFLFLLLSFFSALTFSQKNDKSTVDNFKKLRTTHPSSGYFFNPPREVKGSYHVFRGWNNDGIITSINGETFLIKNINLNIKNNRYESKVNDDSVYAFDSHNLKSVVINSRKFESFVAPKKKEHKIYEVIAKKKAFTLLKDYEIDVKINDHEHDPLMLKPNIDEYVIRSFYYIKRKENIQKFKLNKKNILGLIAKEDKKTFEDYVKRNELSYKKDEDIKKMLMDFKN